MKTLLSLTALVFSISAAAADLDPDWTVVNANGDKFYTVLPKTATQATTKNKTAYVTVVGEFRQGREAKPERFRLGVTGCDDPKIGGTVVMADVTGSTVFVTETWVSGGGRVYDFLAVGACNAYGIQTGKFAPLDEQKPAPKTKAPNLFTT